MIPKGQSESVYRRRTDNGQKIRLVFMIELAKCWKWGWLPS